MLWKYYLRTNGFKKFQESQRLMAGTGAVKVVNKVKRQLVEANKLKAHNRPGNIEKKAVSWHTSPQYSIVNEDGSLTRKSGRILSRTLVRTAAPPSPDGVGPLPRTSQQIHARAASTGSTLLLDSKGSLRRRSNRASKINPFFVGEEWETTKPPMRFR